MAVPRLAAAVGALLLVLGGALSVSAAQPAATWYFPETRLLVSGPFAEFLERHGVDFLGPPLSGPYLERGRLVQWFRDGRLELERGRPVLAQLGSAALGGRPGPAVQPPAQPTPDHAYFPATGQVVSYAILAFYRAHGGPGVLGEPLTPQVGNVQWFERARLEWEPASSTVRLGALGRDAMARAGLDPASFAATWVATHRPAGFRTSDDTPPETLPSWRAFLLLGEQDDGWLRVWDPLRDRFGLLESAAAGAIDPPDWHQGLPLATRRDLPARAVRRGDEVPELGDLPHNAPLVALASYTDALGETHYLTEDGSVLPSRAIRVPRPPDRSFKGKWIDADLREPVLVTAYEDDRPVYSALAVKGAVAFSTPTGVFRIWRRVEDETMDSATIGIPRTAKDGYFLQHVLFTQYFATDGAALHYNYWRSDWGYAGSHGCLGMNYQDSLWFWEWADVGTPVYIHD